MGRELKVAGKDLERQQEQLGGELVDASATLEEVGRVHCWQS